MHEEVIRKSYLYGLFGKILTASQKKFLIRILNSFRMRRLEQRDTPESIVLFITNRCQMGCDFCLYKEKLNTAEKLMSAEELKRLAQSLKNLPRLTMTGGEPFLRDDIDKICNIFNKYARTGFISIPTNGFLTERIQDKVEKILNSTKLRFLKIQLSIDALEGRHDVLREIEGAFSNCVMTLRALKDLQQKYGNLYVEINSVVTHSLIEDIQPFVDYFQDFRIPIKFSIIRNHDFGLYDLNEKDVSKILPKSSSGLPSREELENFYNKVKEINDRSVYKFWSTVQQMKFKNSLTILNHKKRLFPCYAGKFDAVIYSNADLAFCENTVPVGNLRDHDFNFSSVWRSVKADAFRENVKKCVCIHGCNLLTSMSFDVETLVNIEKEFQI